MLLDGKKVLILIANGYTDPELWTPYYRFKEEGAEVVIAAPQTGIIHGEGTYGMNGGSINVTKSIHDAKNEPYDILFLPGGLYGPCELRTNQDALDCVRDSMVKGRMTCAICHAPWILISADVIKGKKIACPKDQAIDVINAGATYVTDPAVKDGNLYTGYAFPQLPELMRLIMDSLRTEQEKTNG